MEERYSTFIWKIHNFSICPYYTRETLYSPVFLADSPYQTHWRLRLHPREMYDKRYVSCYLETHTYNELKERNIDFSISIIDVDRCTVWTSGFNDSLFKQNTARGFPHFIEWDYLMDNKIKMLPQGALTLKCCIRINEQVDSVDDCLKELSDSFKMLYERKEFTDLVLCTDEESFPVHRAVVCARAPKCAQKLSLQNVKNKIHRQLRSRIFLDDIQGNALEAFLIYLYSGRIETTDPEVVTELYNTAEKYELFNMKRDIFPTPTSTTIFTRIPTTSKSVVFPIKNFSLTEKLHMGKLIDLDLVRLGVEFFLAMNVSGKESINFKIWCFSSADTKDALICTVSAIGVDGVPNYTATTEIDFFGSQSAFVFPFPVTKETFISMKDSFLPDDTLRMSFKFTVYDGGEPYRIKRGEIGDSLSLGNSPPSPLTLRRLSEDLEYLTNPKEMRRSYPYVKLDESFYLKKAIFSAWSEVYANSLEDAERRVAKRACVAYARTDLVKVLYHFLCTGKMRITSLETAFELYRQARWLQIRLLEESSSRSFASHLSAENATEALAMTYVEDEKALHSLVQDFICQHSEQIFVSTKWRNLSESNPFIVEETLLRLTSNSESKVAENNVQKKP